MQTFREKFFLYKKKFEIFILKRGKFKASTYKERNILNIDNITDWLEDDITMNKNKNFNI